MKILQLVPYFYPSFSIGGSAEAVYNLSKYLVDKGHDVTVLTTDIAGSKKRADFPHDREVLINGIKTVYFSNISNSLAYIDHLFIPIRYFPYLISRIGKFDIIHMHEIYTPMHVWAGLLAKYKKIPYIITGHGTAMMVKEEGRIGRKKAFWNMGGRYLLKNASRIIALTSLEKTSYTKLGMEEKRISIVPNGIDLNEFDRLPGRNIFRKKYSIQDDKIVLLFLGRIHQKKGIELLIKAMNKLRDKRMTLVIAGPVEDNNYSEKLKNLVERYRLENRIIFTGELNEKTKLQAFSASDIFTLTSYSEGFPITVLEAAAANLPILISDKCGIPEINDHKAGLISELDPDTISIAIDKMVKQKNFRNFFGRNARNMVDSLFSVRKISKIHEKLYEEAINS